MSQTLNLERKDAVKSETGKQIEKTLDLFRPKEKGIVLKVSSEGAIRRRLFDMGITPGTEITMKKPAPLGDPIAVNLRGYELTIRKAEASQVLMCMEVE